MDPDLVNFPPEVAIAIQTGILEGEFRYGLQASYGYGNCAVKEPIVANMGQTLTFTRSAELSPVEDPKAADSYDDDLDNGMSSEVSSLEQYILALRNYSAMKKIDIVAEGAGIGKQSTRAALLLGRQGMHSRDRLVRNELFSNYMGGNTRVVTGGTTSTAAVHVDDIRGFQHKVNSAGELKDVSGTNTLTVNEYTTAGVFVQTFEVSGAQADDPNVSSVQYNNKKYGKSGQLSISPAAAGAPTVGNVLIAANAPKVFRPNGKNSTHALAGGDVYNLQLVSNVVAYLRSQGTPPNDDGYYHVYHDPTSENLLTSDPALQLAFQGKPDSEELRKGFLFEWGGVRFFRTTDAPVQAAGNGVNVEVHRPIVVGGESVIEADWKGVDAWLNTLRGRRGLHAIAKAEHNICFIVRPPIDAQARILTFSWYLPTGYCCGTDLGAKKDTIPTANEPAMFKRAAVIEHAG